MSNAMMLPGGGGMNLGNFFDTLGNSSAYAVLAYNGTDETDSPYNGNGYYTGAYTTNSSKLKAVITGYYTGYIQATAKGYYIDVITKYNTWHVLSYCGLNAAGRCEAGDILANRTSNVEHCVIFFDES